MPIDPRRIEVIDDQTAAMLRAMSPAEKLEAANLMVVQAREMVTHIVRTNHPDWTPQQVDAEVARRVSRGAA